MILRVFWKVKGDLAYLHVQCGEDGFQDFRDAGDLVMSAAHFVALTHGHVQSEFYEEGDLPR